MRFESLDQWLEWQMGLHDKAIELGLDRVGRVAERLGLNKIAQQVITVAGTNGKGSSVAAYENWLHQAGYRVASYTSPHLLEYNERVKYNLEPVSDADLCAAFDAVEAVRDDTALTYFEYGTLAALYLIQQWQPDYAILEVGLGGRLDAVNIIDADLVHLTPIGLDHQAWLGNDQEKIGYEKAGVLRAGIAVVLNDPDPPRSVVEEIERLNCRCLQYGRDFDMTQQTDGGLLWRYRDLELHLDNVLPGLHQAHNLAGVVAGLSLLSMLDNYDAGQVRKFFHGTQLAGRFQQLESPLACRLYIDVGHNQDAARALASNIAAIKRPGERIVVLLGMLGDKHPDLFVEAMKHDVDGWWLTTLDSDRGLSAAQLASRIESMVTAEHLFDSVADALDHALSSLGNQDIMLVTGSFITVEFLLRALCDSNPQN